MAAKLTCPECEKTLTLANAPAPGKKVRCPRCQAVFAVPEADGDLEEAEAPAPKQKAAIKKNAPAKPAAKSEPKPAPPEPKKSSLDDEEESAGTYGFAMSEEEEQSREKEKPKIDYAPDLTVKDPRGKAVAILAKPSTLLICDGGIITLAAVLTFSVGIWPFFFANTVAPTRKAIEVSQSLEKQIKDLEQKASGGKGGGAKREANLLKDLKKKIEKEEEVEDLAPLVDPLIEKTKPSEEYIRSAKPEDLEKEDKVAFRVWKVLEDRATTFHIWLIVLSIPVALYGATMTVAGVKMQTLESYQWSLVGSAMGILIGVGATIGFIIMMFGALDQEEAGVMDYLQPLFGVLYNIGGIAATTWGLLTVMDPKIKEAFFFDPEKDVQEQEEAATDEEEEEDEDEEEE